MYWYWWVWVAIVVLLVLLPLGYGWGYRDWGPPYPRYYYRRRAARTPSSSPATPDPRGDDGHQMDVLVEERVMPPAGPPESAWGIAADLVWLAVLGAAIWAIVAFLY